MTLYQGGQYFLYKYKRYDDVRLVFAPEQAIAAFGGDPDNFNFPRWCLDFSLHARLRERQAGAHAGPPALARRRAAAGEPVFVAGHPGSTSRLLTVEQLKFQRDVSVPAYLARNSELRGRLIQWAQDRRRAAAHRAGHAAGPTRTRSRSIAACSRALLDDALIDAQDDAGARAARARQRRIRSSRSRPATRGTTSRRRRQRYREIYDRYLYLESGTGFNSKLFGYARQLVRGAAERAKPNEQRLREYADSNLPKIERGPAGGDAGLSGLRDS